MAKKQFKFEEMQNMPIVNSANDIMVKAFEQKSTQPEQEKVENQPEEKEQINEESSKEELISQVEETKKRVAKVKNSRDYGDQLRKEWQEINRKYTDTARCRNVQLMLPMEMHRKLEAIKDKLDTGDATKLVKKSLCFIAIEEFLEKYGE